MGVGGYWFFSFWNYLFGRIVDVFEPAEDEFILHDLSDIGPSFSGPFQPLF